MEKNKTKDMGNYDTLFFKVLPFFLQNSNEDNKDEKSESKKLVCVSCSTGNGIFGFKGTLTDIKPYDYITIDNEIMHFIDKDSIILFLGYYNKKNKVQTLYRPDLFNKLKYKFQNKTTYLGYPTDGDADLIQDQQKILGYSVKLDQLTEGYYNIGKPTSFPRQYLKK